VPPGFVVEQVAGPPLVEHPIFACFDERGRLFVAETAGRNLPYEDLAKSPPSRILLLEDTDGDGHFDKRTVFADKMTFPMGVLWHRGALYSCAPPSVWKLEDIHGKGVADRRTELVTRFGSSGNGADIHGPFLGPDGRLYWTDGRHGHEIKRPDGRVLKGLAARVFRCRPDGRDVEAVCGGGMDDPVGMAFTDEGEAFAAVDIFVGRPSRIDALIHCVEGGAFPYYEQVLGEFKRTGDLLPAMTELGWVAPSGLTRYRGTALGNDFTGNLFSAHFNRHRVQRHVLERAGATFRTRDEDFLTSPDVDFHPTDVLEDADGSLLVIDTGGWFQIGCPTSRIAKPEVKGAIYRVRRQDAPKATDPRGLALPWDRLSPAELAGLLDDPRFAVRDRAVEELAGKGDAALPALGEALKAHAPRTRRNAVWALARMESAGARAAVRTSIDDREMSVRLAAVHTAGLNRDAEAGPRLEKRLGDADAAVRREAATGLGRLRRRESVPALLDGLGGGSDRFLEHALIYALIEIADREATGRGLHDASPAVRRAALIALDQMDGGNLTRAQVTPFLGDADTQDTALAVIAAHPGWAKETVGLLGEWLAQEKPDARRERALRTALLAFSKEAAVQELVAKALRDEKTPPPSRLLLLEAVAQAPLDKLPSAWVAEVGRALGHPEERVVRQAVATVHAARLAGYDGALRKIAADESRPADLRLAALAAAAPRLGLVDPPLFNFLRTCLEKEPGPLERLTAAQALGAVRLNDAQLLKLADAFGQAGALEMPHLLAAYENGKSAAVGQRLVAALAQAPGLRSLEPASLRRALAPYPEAVRKEAEPLFKKLSVDVAAQKARLAELEPLLSGGDAGRGREVFFGRKAACSTCHAVKNEGGRIGPDLSTVGAQRGGRDLLESVVFPSASFVRGYEPYLVTTRDGRSHTGILARETAEAIYLVTAERAEVRVPRAAVETFERSRVSIMPQGLDAQLSRQELSDLLAFLQGLR
jgi:putative membrane-bound dehydrogenase-like protein